MGIGKYPVYDANGKIFYSNSYAVDSDYIAIIKDGSGVGRLQYCVGQSSYIGTLGALIPLNCSTYYLFAALQTINFQKYITGMAIPHIYFKDYKSEKIPFPQKDLQDKISEIFVLLDSKINLERRLLDKLVEEKSELLNQIFI